MVKTTAEVCRRIRALGIRIGELRSSGASGHPVLAATVADLQAEQAVWKLLLVTRRLQLQDKVVNLARWRDGYSAVPSQTPSVALASLPRPGTDRPRLKQPEP